MTVEYFQAVCHTRLTKDVLSGVLWATWWQFKGMLESLNFWLDVGSRIGADFSGLKGVRVGDYEIVDRPSGDEKGGFPHADFKFILTVDHNHPVSIVHIIAVIEAVAALLIALSIFAITVSVVSPPPAGLGGIGGLILVALAVLALFLIVRG